MSSQIQVGGAIHRATRHSWGARPFSRFYVSCLLHTARISNVKSIKCGINKNQSVTNVNSWIWKWLLKVVLQLFSIDDIHDSCHDGFHIIMQISHVVSQGANNEMMPFLGESALLSSELSAPKSPLRAKLWNNDFIVKVSLKKSEF